MAAGDITAGALLWLECGLTMLVDLLFWMGTLLLSVLAILLAIFSIRLVLQLNKQQRDQADRIEELNTEVLKIVVKAQNELPGQPGESSERSNPDERGAGGD